MQSLKRFRQDFDPKLEAFLVSKLSACKQLTSDIEVRNMIQYIHTLIQGGGKRIRPFLACLMYEGVGGKRGSTMLEASIALELFHLFGLIHDDIIDRGTNRHGIPTAHLHIAKRLQKNSHIQDHHHIAEGQAILLGDLLHAWSTDIMAKARRFGEAPSRLAWERYHAMANEVIIGQMLDVEITTRTSTAALLIDEKMFLKTASYTFIRPMQIGAAFFKTSARIDKFCEIFGLALGLAFQIQDDLLDLTADAKTLQKTVFSDLSEQQHTIFTQYIFDHGTKSQQKELKSMLGETLSETDRPRITELFESSGSFEYGKKLMTQYLDQAGRSLQGIQLNQAAKTGLTELVAYMRDRQM